MAHLDENKNGSDGDDDDDDEEATILVIDNGSGLMKAGYDTKKNYPQLVFPSVVGHQKKHDIGKEWHVGEETIGKHELLQIVYPIERGVIDDWDGIEKIWSETFAQLETQPDETTVMLSEPPLNSRTKREKTTHLMFESFAVPELYIANQAIMSLFAQGSITGIVLDSGHTVTHSTPIYEGYALPHATTCLEVGGWDVSQFLEQLISQRGIQLPTFGLGESLIESEKLFYIAMNYDSEFEFASFEAEQLMTDPSSVGRHGKNISRTVELPDGHRLTLTTERFKAPELMFNPAMAHFRGRNAMAAVKHSKSKSHGRPRLISTTSMASPVADSGDAAGVELPIGDVEVQLSVTGMIANSVSKVSPQLRTDMLSNIVLCGGNTLLNGFGDRLAMELNTIATTELNINPNAIKINAKKHRQFLCWIGGCIYSNTESFRQGCVTKDEYDEFGPIIVHRKCF